MFGLGFVEIAAICFVALIFIRPKDLPRLFRKIGKVYAQVSAQINAAKQVIKNLENELPEKEGDIADSGKDLEGER